MLLTEDDYRVYHLEDQSLLWVDVDMALMLLKEAEQRGRTSSAALLLLEEAVSLFSKGMLLQDEEGSGLQVVEQSWNRLTISVDSGSRKSMSSNRCLGRQERSSVYF